MSINQSQTYVFGIEIDIGRWSSLSWHRWGKPPNTKVAVSQLRERRPVMRLRASVAVQEVILSVVLARLHLDQRVPERFAYRVQHDVDVERLLHHAVHQAGFFGRQLELTAGYDHDRHTPRGLVAAPLAQNVQAVGIVQVQVEEDQIGRAATRQ